MDLIVWIARRMMPVLRRALVFALYALLLFPWYAVIALRFAASAIRALIGLPRRFRLSVADTVACPRCGLQQSLLQRWRCPICKGIETTHAWSRPCRICGADYPAGYIVCEDRDCAEAIPNPLLGGVR